MGAGESQRFQPPGQPVPNNGVIRSSTLGSLRNRLPIGTDWSLARCGDQGLKGALPRGAPPPVPKSCGNHAVGRGPKCSRSTASGRYAKVYESDEPSSPLRLAYCLLPPCGIAAVHKIPPKPGLPGRHPTLSHPAM